MLKPDRIALRQENYHAIVHSKGNTLNKYEKKCLAEATVYVSSAATKRTHRASRSDSRRARMSLTRTGPLTLRMMEREVSSMNSTRTWVTPPREPVRPRTCGLAMASEAFGHRRGLVSLFGSAEAGAGFGTGRNCRRRAIDCTQTCLPAIVMSAFTCGGSRRDGVVAAAWQSFVVGKATVHSVSNPFLQAAQLRTRRIENHRSSVASIAFLSSSSSPSRALPLPSSSSSSSSQPLIPPSAVAKFRAQRPTILSPCPLHFVHSNPSTRRFRANAP